MEVGGKAKESGVLEVWEERATVSDSADKSSKMRNEN